MPLHKIFLIAAYLLALGVEIWQRATGTKPLATLDWRAFQLAFVTILMGAIVVFAD
jgi:hypothetical protein